MSATPEKNIKEVKTIVFDDTMLPVSRISAAESDRIENIVMPLLEEELKKLRLSKPHLFTHQQ